MNAGDLLAIFREDVQDDVVPYLWPDVEVYRYINDAYFMFVRRTGGISDATSGMTRIPIVTDRRDAAIDESILRIRDAYLVSNNRKVHIINAQDLDNLTQEDYGILQNINNVTTSGAVRYMVTGLEDGLVRWVQVPAEDDTLQMIVERLPDCTISKAKDCFEGVREEHHYHLLKWVRHLAYRKQDVDRFDLVKSDQERDDFLVYCGMAQNEKNIRRHKVRVVRYGGI